MLSLKLALMTDYIIFGATSGIGREIASSIIGRGDRVISISRSESGLEGSLHIPLDVTSGEVPVDQIPEACAGFVYCPGTINLRPFRSLKLKVFEEDMAINFFGAVSAAKACVPKLAKGKSSMVFFSTVAVQQGMPFHTSVASAKGAIEGFSRALAAELAPDVRVNCIAPSLTDTPLASRLLGNDARRQASEDRHPMKRVGKPSDIAEMALFLLDKRASWITGQVIGVDGGMSSLR